jgi:hypothetical protein
VSSLAEEARYAVVTEEVLDEIFNSRVLHSSLFSTVEDEDMAFTAKMVLSALLAVREELKRRIG